MENGRKQNFAAHFLVARFQKSSVRTLVEKLHTMKLFQWKTFTLSSSLEEEQKTENGAEEKKEKDNYFRTFKRNVRTIVVHVLNKKKRMCLSLPQT